MAGSDTGAAPCDRDTATAYVLGLSAAGIVACISPYGTAVLHLRHADWVKLLGFVLLAAGVGGVLSQQYMTNTPSKAVVITSCVGVVAGAALGGVGSALGHRADATRLHLARAVRRL